MAGKTDKGFQLNYWKLSYRRKFYRTLWMTPLWLIIIILIVYKLGLELTIVFAAVILISMGIQLIYNYNKWKAEEREASVKKPDDTIYNP